MKIEQLVFEKGSPARLARRATQRANQQPEVNAFSQMQQKLAQAPAAANTMANTPVSATNTAAPTNPNLKVVPGGQSAEPNELDALKKNAGIPQQPVTTTTSEPAAQPADAEPDAAAEPEAGQPATSKVGDAAKKAWDYANSPQSGADLQKFGAGMADAGGSLSRGAQTVAQGTGKLVKGVGTGVADVGHGLGHALGGVGSVAKGVGDVAAQAAGGVGQTISSLAGGLKHGWDTASRGQKFGGGGYSGQGTSTPSAPAVSGGAGGSNYSSGGDEVASLRATIGALDRRMRNAGI